jgi:putative nucleotidyltransferase with HDIG domain
MTRTEAYALLTEYTKNPNLIKHGLAVEAVMRQYAELYQQDSEEWGIVGLLHDFDYEIHPTADEHPQKGAVILRQRGVSEEIIDAILAHAPHTGEPRDTQLKKAIFASDELAGLVVAVALVRPNKLLSEVTVESVMKKLNQPSFAAKVNRDEIHQGTAELGVPLEKHVQTVIESLQAIHSELGL